MNLAKAKSEIVLSSRLLSRKRRWISIAAAMTGDGAMGLERPEAANTAKELSRGDPESYRELELQ